MSNPENPLAVRQVTDLHANWSEQGADQDGKFSFQLILDDGAEEAIIRPSAEAAKTIIAEFVAGNSFFYDTSREVLLLRGLL